MTTTTVTTPPAMPSDATARMEHQSQEYRDSVLPAAVDARVAIEQASAFGWGRYVGRRGRVIGMHTFGASAPLKALQQEYGFTVDAVVAAARAVRADAAARSLNTVQ